MQGTGLRGGGHYTVHCRLRGCTSLLIKGAVMEGVGGGGVMNEIG